MGVLQNLQNPLGYRPDSYTNTQLIQAEVWHMYSQQSCPHLAVNYSMIEPPIYPQAHIYLTT